MEQQVFRKKSLERLSSPEELDDYLHVTTPSVWVLLAAIVLLLAGLFIWSAHTALESSVPGRGRVSDGVITISFDSSVRTDQISPGMTVKVGEIDTTIDAVGTDGEGNLIASAALPLPDGDYEARVRYRQTKIIGLLLN